MRVAIPVLVIALLMSTTAAAAPPARTPELVEYFGKYDYDGAIKRAEQLLLERPNDENVLTDLLVAYVSLPRAATDAERTARRSKVIVVCERLVTINPSHRLAKQVLAALKGSASRPKVERTQVGETLFSSGLERYKRNEWQKAIDCLSGAISENPKDWEALMLRGHTYLLSGQVAPAEEDLAKATSFAPEDYLSWLYLGDARKENDDLDGARDCYVRAYVLNPKTDVTCGRLVALGEHMGFSLAALPVFKTVEVVSNEGEVILRVRKATMSEQEKNLWMAYASALAKCVADREGAPSLEDDANAYGVMIDRYRRMRTGGESTRPEMQKLAAIDTTGMLPTYVALYADLADPERARWVRSRMADMETFVKKFLLVPDR